MLIVGIADQREVHCIADLEAVLRIRYDGDLNCFWLPAGNEEFPVLVVYVKGDLAGLTYYREEGDPGLRSVGDLAETLEGKATTFSISKYHGDDIDIVNCAVIPWLAASDAAKEFFETKELPKCVEWAEWYDPQIT